MDASVTPAGGLAYTERDVTALLDSRGGRLYWYFWVMLGDQTTVTRALAGTVIVAAPDPAPRQLFEVAHAVCRQHHPAAAMPYARAEEPTLAAVTRAALRRLEPGDREICVLGASAYRLNDADLAAVLEIRSVEDLWSRAMDAFAFQLAACATDAGLAQGEDLVERALRLFGAAQSALPYDEIVRLATDPAAQWLREGIRARVGMPDQAAMAQQGGLELLGTESQLSVTVQGLEDAELMTIPLPRVQVKGGQHARRRRGAMAGTVLAAGVIPVALAVAWAGYTQSGGTVSAVPPLSATVGSPHNGGAASVANGSANRSNGYQGRHARPGSGAQQSGTSGTSGTTGTTGTSGTSGTSGASGTSGTSSYMQAPSAPTYATAPAPAPAPTTPVVAPTTPAPAPPPPAPAPSPTPTKPGKGVGRGNGSGNPQ